MLVQSNVTNDGRKRVVDSEDYPDERDVNPEKFDPLHRDHPMFEGWADEDTRAT
jgi:hypothetical protein